MTEFFAKRGYEAADIPTIVDMSMVEQANSRFSKNVLKLFDEAGQTLALRTELTQPLAKMVASYHTKLEFPQKYFYNANVFRFKGSQTDSAKELKQVGVECFGQDAKTADKETINLLLDAVEKISLKNYRVSITDARIWQKVFELYGDKNMSFSDELDNLDTQASALLKDDSLSLAAQVYKALKQRNLVKLEKLVAGKAELEIFAKSSDIKDFEKAFDLDLSNLTQLTGLCETVVFEPLQCPDLRLYTGLHFMLNAQGSGAMLALGGRYDKLCAKFGADISAIGFAFYVKELNKVLDKKPSKKTLKIAAAKGGLFEKAQSFLEAKGLSFPEDRNRKLILELDAENKFGFEQIEVLLVRGHDVPVYVENGGADLGIVGLDVVLDSKASCYLLKDLEYGHCRLSVCAIKDRYKTVFDLPKQTRVATTFPNLAKEFFSLKGINAEVINLYGSVELGPLTDLSEVIVDLVATGKTLKENNLEELESFLDCSAYLIANNSSYKLYKENLNKLLT